MDNNKGQEYFTETNQSYLFDLQICECERQSSSDNEKNQKSIRN